MARKRQVSQEVLRKPDFGPPRKRILIVCEGKVTETEYFKSFQAKFKNRLVRVDIDRRAGAPKALVQRAIRIKKESEENAHRRQDIFLRYDQVWCVFDVDDNPDLSPLHKDAEQNNINLAISNPCFELWALLHFQDHTSYVERKPLTSLLRRHLPGYQKALPFEKLSAGYTQAVQRAAALDCHREDAEDPGGKGACLNEMSAPPPGVILAEDHLRERTSP